MFNGMSSRYSKGIYARMIAPIVALFALGACSNSESTVSSSPAVETAASRDLALRTGAPLFEGMGEYRHPISSVNADAQRYFNQGMVLYFGFNHAEAIRSFRAAQRLDDNCAICYWAEALATGPNINVTSNGKAVMSRDERVAACAALTQAIERKPFASEVERDYIDALGTRYSANPEDPREPLDQAYANGVPMGGDLPAAPDPGAAPGFVVQALKDPGTASAPGTDLERIQIIKGWVTVDGQSQVEVFDIAGGPNGASVDTSSCETQGAGQAQLCAYWVDPAYNPAERAWYYARVVENPVCRWTTRDCNALAAAGEELPGSCDTAIQVIQERAWTSPIWN